MSKFRVGAALAAALAQAACASGPSSIEARYVSPNTYQAWTCPQLFDEKARVSSELDRASGLQKENATADAVIVGAGIIVAPILLIGLAATKDRKDEIGRLKGEYEAVDTNIKAKQCTPGGPDSGTAVASATARSFDGKYEGSGKTDSWCQTPSMNVQVAGNIVTGTISEVSSGAATGTVSGDVATGGDVALNIKSSSSSNANGLYRGRIAGNTLSIDVKNKAANACTHRFAIDKVG